MNDHGPHVDRSPWRWPRVLVIATAAVILASCRSITQPLVLPLAAVAVATEESAEATSESSTAVVQTTSVVQAGCEAPCGPLPRRPLLHSPAVPNHQRVHGTMPCAAPANGVCQTNMARGHGSCETCNQTVCMPLAQPVPMVGPCLVCDGGDARAPAMPVARFGLKNLTSGDTVARYRADDDSPDSCDVHVTASNCACVYAPRFGSVRQVTRPHEDARPIGPRGLAIDVATEAKIDLQPVCRSTQSLAPEAARKALPGVALEERLGPLAVDQGDPVYESDGLVQPVEDVRDEHLERAELVQTPRMMVGFDVPLAWTCARAAMVMVGRQQAEVVAADRGTATLRLESPGRAELTLCKRAGSDTARVGEELDFMIYLYNSGDRALTDIVLVDALPGRLEFVPGSAAANQPAEFGTDKGDDGSVVLKWQFQHTFKPGEGGFVRFRTVVR
jgi:uncharacterized repeat protein (TIGR01451 family)